VDTIIGLPRVRTIAPATVIIEGEFDANSAGILRDAVRSLPEGPRHVDASGVTFAGTAVLGALLQLQQECAPGSLTLTASPTLERLVGLAGLDDQPPFC